MIITSRRTLPLTPYPLSLTLDPDPADQANRQSEPHAHAIVLDPYFGKVAFIPDLGMVSEKRNRRSYITVAVVGFFIRRKPRYIRST